jgi:hypothetical protein
VVAVKVSSLRGSVVGMTHQPANLTCYGSDGLLVRLDSLRARLAQEPDPTVKTFVALELEDVVAEMRRRTDVRINAIAIARLS